jgi:hypothetical protein
LEADALRQRAGVHRKDAKFLGLGAAMTWSKAILVDRLLQVLVVALADICG